MEVSVLSWEKQTRQPGRRRGPPLKSVYGVSKLDVETFVDGNQVVREWLRKYPARTKKGYAYELCRYFKWLKIVKGIDLSPREFLNEHFTRSKLEDVVERRKHLSLALEYSRDNPDFGGSADTTKRFIFNVIRSFYHYNELTLTHNRGVFGRVRHKFNAKQITLLDAKQLMEKLGERDRAILLIMLHSGASAGDVLDHMNYMWDQIEPQLERGNNVVKVEMPPRKNSSMPYFTYFGHDAIYELKKWLIKRQQIVGRPMQRGEPIFITSWGTPLKTYRFIDIFHKKLVALGLKKEAYSIRSHMWRRLFKTEAGIPERRVDRDIVEYMMGHSNNVVSAVGGTYDKAPEIYEEVIEGEWRKIIPYLNIYSKPETAQEDRSEELAYARKLYELLEKDPEFSQILKEYMKKKVANDSKIK